MLEYVLIVTIKRYFQTKSRYSTTSIQGTTLALGSQLRVSSKATNLGIHVQVRPIFFFRIDIRPIELLADGDVPKSCGGGRELGGM